MGLGIMGPEIVSLVIKIIVPISLAGVFAFILYLLKVMKDAGYFAPRITAIIIEKRGNSERVRITKLTMMEKKRVGGVLFPFKLKTPLDEAVVYLSSEDLRITPKGKSVALLYSPEKGTYLPIRDVKVHEEDAELYSKLDIPRLKAAYNEAVKEAVERYKYTEKLSQVLQIGAPLAVLLLTIILFFMTLSKVGSIGTGLSEAVVQLKNIAAKCVMAPPKPPVG